MGNKLSKCMLSNHSSVIIGNEVFIWGGSRPDLPQVHNSPIKRELTLSIDVLNVVNSTFITRRTTGTPHNGMIGYTSCSIGNNIYYFGGSCTLSNCYHNNLFMLNTESYEWREIYCDIGPMRKRGCGMIPFSINGEDYLLVIGGHSPKPSYPLSNPQSLCYTKEVHITCVSTTPGKWTVPRRTGSVFTPSAYFSINTLPGNRAIIFGGTRISENHNIYCSNDVFVVSYTNDTVDFQRLCNAMIQWPIKRSDHSSVVISSVSDSGIERHYLVVLGGWDSGLKAIADCWILEIDRKEWKKISLPELVTKRFCHSMTAYKMLDNYAWLIIVGGRNDISSNLPISGVNRLMIVELVFSPANDNWTVTNVLNEKDMNNTANYTKLVSDRLLKAKMDYKQESIRTAVPFNKLQRLMGTGREEQDQEMQVMDKGKVDVSPPHREIEETTQQAVLVEQNRTKDEIIRETEATVQVLLHQTEEIGSQNEVLLQQKEATIQQKEATIQQKEAIIQQNQAEIRSLQEQLNRRPWKLEREEVELTDQRIGGGAFGTVWVATFRGTRVAAKLIHEVIISDYNLGVFTREMEISAQIHHPNIVQFIGATRYSNPILLYELMNTSLHKQLQEGKPLTHQQIIDIASNICTAMCYLHQSKPQPIIHRDISSPNVLMEPLPNDKWRAKLSDFGSASLQLHIKTVIPGNPAYAAPEAVIPQHHTPAMDVYSFGVLLTEMTQHRAPVMDSNEREIMAHSIDWIEMRDIVLQCINDDRTQRLTSEQLLTQLQKL